MSRNNLEDIYPLSPLQQGLLFHSLYESGQGEAGPGGGAGVYVVQVGFTLRGALDVGAYVAAWQHVIDRHTALRTAFVWERFEGPMQIVWRRVKLPAHEEDLRGLSAAEQAERVARFVDADRKKGFDLRRAPLMRVALLRLADDAWRLVWTSHHLLLDGWSTQIVLREVMVTYEHKRAGKEPHVRGDLPGDPPLEKPRPYGEYIAWLGKQDKAAMEAFWRRELAGLAAPTRLGVDHAPLPSSAESFRERRVSLSDASSLALVAFTRQHKLTASTLLQGAWAALLARTGGDRDVLFGATVSGRSAAVPGVERMIGLFINTLPVRVRVDEDARVIDFLTALQAHEAELRELEHSPLAEVQTWSEMPRATQLFQTLVVFENYPIEESPAPEGGAAGARDTSGRLRVEAARSVERTGYPITLAGILKGRLVLELVYDERRFDAAVIDRMLGHLMGIIEAMVASPSAKVADLPVLTRPEREALAKGLHASRARYPSALLHELVAAQAARTPSAVAVSFRAEKLTYEALDRAGNRLARALQRRGVGPGDRVAVVMDRSLALPVALLGALKAGGGYVPVDPSYPADRVASMLADAGAKAVIASPSASGIAGLDASRALVLGDDLASIADEPSEAPACGATSEGLAYVIFTSGSTGRPKGAMIPHRAIVNHMCWMAEAYPLDPSAIVLQKTPISFDASVWEFWAPLMSGATLVMAEPEGHRDPRYLARAVAAHGVTVLQLVPSMLELLVEEPELAACTSLQRVFLGGEALRSPLVQRLRARLPDVTIVNLYGPTEVTIDSVAHTYRDERDERDPVVPIGRPITNVTAYVLDDRMRLLPEGAAGELYLGGAGVGLGYIGRADLTAERFLPNPFDEGLLYKTGDRARWLASGELVYLGRADDQVKIRGFRVELGEIEAVIAAHEAVREAVVALRGAGNAADARLVAYVTAKEGGGPIDTANLRARLKERLPEHMIPAAFAVLDALPRLPNGKVNRAALPDVEAALAPEGAAFVPPRGPFEEAIASIFQEVLKVESVSALDSFFELGGHSILATQAVSRIRDVLGADVALRAIFESPTVAELAARVREVSGKPAPAPIARAPRDGELRLSFGQERLFFVDQLDPGNPAFNVPSNLRFEGTLDEIALAKALAALSARHEVLRTTFALSPSGVPVQVIHDSMAVPLAIMDLRGQSPDEQRAVRRREAAAEAGYRFDLQQGPLVRAKVLLFGDSDWVLLLTMHHIVSDAWTQAILNRELSALYTACAAGQTAVLPPLPIQYADYAAAQRALLAGERLDALLAYWRASLSGASFTLELPTDKPRPPAQSFRGSIRTMELGPELGSALDTLARKSGVTLYMVLLAALDVMLARWTGQRDFVVGTSIAGRTLPETERLMGFFINALPLRASVDPNEPFSGLLGRVKETCLGAYEHQDMPFERLVSELQPAPDPSRTPIFQVIFTMVTTPREELRLGEAKVRAVGGEVTSVKYDLTFFVGQSPRGPVLSFAYNTDLFEARSVDQMLAALRAILTAVARDPKRKVADLPVMSDDERRRVTGPLAAEDPAAAPQVDAAHARLHELFEARASATPGAIALVTNGLRLSFAALDERANKLARHLLALGAGPDDVIGVCLDRASFVPAMLGVLKSDAAYVPIDPAYPDERVAELLRESGAKLWITTEARAARVATRTSARAVRLDADAAAIAAHAGDRPEGRGGPANLAYVLFTSGSTGKPKGVAVEHGNVVSYLFAVASRMALPEGARYAHVSTFSADLGNTVLFPPLCLGGELHVLDEALVTDPDAIGRYFTREAIDCLKIVPSHLSALLSGARPGDVIPRALVVLGGEASSWDLIRTIHSLRPGCRVMNHYGPTETTVGALTYAVDDGGSGRASAPYAPKPPDLDAQPEGAPIVPLGRPLAGCRVYVLDSSMGPLPAGVPGEVYIGGPQVARGYLGRPDLTAERFLPSPFVSGDRLYKTGDRAKWLADGSLLFLGRADFQVKIRGYRIELGEVEAALSTAPSVREAVALALDDPRSKSAVPDKRLVAFVTAKQGEIADAEAVRAHVGARLPDAMVPSLVVVLDAIPLTPNGKIDRKALASLADKAPEPAKTLADAPRNPVEEVLAAIWADVFERDAVGVHERFADLGGHSLLAIQIVARARDAFGIDLPLRAIFEAPTIAELALRVDEARRAEGAELPPPIRRMPRSAQPVLSFAQERLWFLEQLDPGNTAYNITYGLRMKGDLDAGALERAIAEVVRRHEVLRTTFVQPKGSPGPIAVIHEDVVTALPVTDLSAYEERAREEELVAITKRESTQRFDLAKGPLFVPRLVRLGAHENVLFLTMHHVVSDAWTRGVLAREITTLYEAFHEGSPSPLPELALQYADYAHWQRKWLAGGVLDREIAHHKSELAGAPHVLELPTDKPRPAVQSHRGGKHVFRIAPDVAKAVRDLGKREGATLFMTLFAAFAVLLHRTTGQRDMLVGTPVANRSRPEIEGLIGFFVNTLVLRAKVDPQASFADLLGTVRETCLRAYAHQDLPFERLVQELSPERDMSRTPLFQVMFTVEDRPAEGIAIAGVERKNVALEITTSKFDLTLSLMNAPSGLYGMFEYATDLFEAPTMRRFGDRLRALLTAVAQDPSRPIAALPIVADDEQRLIASANADRSVRFPVSETIAQRFSKAVERAPDAVAITFGDVRVTYRDLEARASRFAHHLKGLGVGPNTLVGLAMERSELLLVALMGILFAGGAYLPLDPDYPKDRLSFMIEDAKIRVLVTDRKSVKAFIVPDGVTVIHLDEVEGSFAKLPETPPEGGASPGDLAYVIYTSGSTGKPKGAMVSHENVVRLFDATDAWYKFGPDDVWTLFHSYAFDFSVWEMWGAFLYGGRLVVVPYLISRSPDDFYTLVAREGVTVLNQTPSAFRQFVKVDELTSERRRAALALRYVIFGGEALDLNELRPWWERHGDAKPQLVNMYGITETTVHVTYRPVSLDDLARPWSSVIGRPIPDLQVYVLDEHKNQCPIGVTGEMYVGGAGVSRGYLNRPELTAERFLPSPFAVSGDERLYKTGDLARLVTASSASSPASPAVDIEYLGRIDHQVKIRGFRIELGEIESVLGEHPAVRSVVVLARDDGKTGNKTLVAYIVPAHGGGSGKGALKVADLRAHIKEKLPEYMVPSAFVTLDALPLTENGKVDRRALPAPDMAPSGTNRELAPPRNGVEEALASLYAEVLQIPVDKISIRDSFFDLGGHSMLLPRLFNDLIVRMFGEKLPIGTIYQHPTIAALAEVLSREVHAVPRSLIEMNPLNGARMPLFWCGFNFAEMTRIARELPDQPIYHLQSGYFDVESPSTHIRELAKRYLRDIRVIQPEGPYYLAGSCLDGYVAYEIGQQLLQAGEEVGLLMLVERDGPEAIYRRYQAIRGTYYRLRAHERRVLRLPWERRVQYVKDLFGRVSHRTKARLSTRDEYEQTVLAYGKDNFVQMAKTALRAYLPGGKHEGRVALIFSKATLRGLPTGLFPMVGWSGMFKGPHTFNVVAGDHESVASDANVKDFAQCVRELLDEAMREHPGAKIPKPPKRDED